MYIKSISNGASIPAMLLRESKQEYGHMKSTYLRQPDRLARRYHHQCQALTVSALYDIGLPDKITGSVVFENRRTKTVAPFSYMAYCF